MQRLQGRGDWYLSKASDNTVRRQQTRAGEAGAVHLKSSVLDIGVCLNKGFYFCEETL